MDFTKHLITYYRVERLEAFLLALFGLVTIGIALVMWQYIHQNHLLKGWHYTLGFLGGVSLLAGSFNTYSSLLEYLERVFL